MFISMPIIYFLILLIFEDAIDGRSVTDSTQNVHSFIKSSDLIYGDMLLPPQVKNRALTTNRLDGKWPNGIIPYTFKTQTCDSTGKTCTFKDIPSHDATQRQTIVLAMRSMEKATAFNSKPCIQFRPKLPSDSAYISIFNGQGCYARLGYYPESEGVVSLGSGCIYQSIIIHELMHTLDFHHEHQRPDRDQYIKINWENILEGAEGNFALDRNMNMKQDTPYDYNSVMHYDSRAASKNGKNTIEIKPPGKPSSPLDNLSDIDVLSIRKVYQCFNKGNEVIVGIGGDNQLWTRASLTSNWVHVPNSGHVIGVTVLQDGTILGIGGDNQLWTRASLTSNWVLIPNSGHVIGVTVLQDGTILGIGTDKQLYTRASLTSNWVFIPYSGFVIAVTVLY